MAPSDIFVGNDFKKISLERLALVSPAAEGEDFLRSEMRGFESFLQDPQLELTLDVSIGGELYDCGSIDG